MSQILSSLHAGIGGRKSLARAVDVTSKCGLAVVAHVDLRFTERLTASDSQCGTVYQRYLPPLSQTAVY